MDDATDKAGLTIPNTASRGQEIIRDEIHNLKEQFDGCFTTCSDSQIQLGKCSDLYTKCLTAFFYRLFHVNAKCYITILYIFFHRSSIRTVEEL